MLVRLLGGLRPLEHHGVEGRSKELVVAYVRPGHHRKRTTVGLDQKGAFHPVLAPIGRAGAYEAPQSGPCPSLRRPPATRSSLRPNPRTPRPRPPRPVEHP